MFGPGLSIMYHLLLIFLAHLDDGFLSATHHLQDGGAGSLAEQRGR